MSLTSNWFYKNVFVNMFLPFPMLAYFCFIAIQCPDLKNVNLFKGDRCTLRVLDPPQEKNAKGNTYQYHLGGDYMANFSPG